jgi:hypothetical protein
LTGFVTLSRLPENDLKKMSRKKAQETQSGKPQPK